MMTNLFSSFDPSTSLASMNWMVTMCALPTMMICTNMKPNKMKSTMKMTMIKLKEELKSNLQTSMKSDSTTMFITIFLILSINNLMALNPFVFSNTSHIMITLPMSLTMWASMMMFAMRNSTKKLLIHLVPTGTPNLLLPVMVMIEMTSNLIRPITLSVRLAANMVAGHLLLILLSNLLMKSITITVFMWPIMILLSILELSVAIIQAYVFTTLCTLYFEELQ